MILIMFNIACSTVEGNITAAIAHPHEANDGTVYNIRIAYGRCCKWVLSEIPPKSDDPSEKPFDDGKAICTISPYSNLAYLHSFAMTENYFVVVENPLMFSIAKLLLKNIVGYTVEDALYWDPDQLSIFHVIDRSTGNEIGKFKSQPFFCFHHINAYENEDSENIVIDLCGYKDASLVQQLYLHNLRSGNGLSISDVRRYSLPLHELGEPNKTKILPQKADGLDFELLFRGLELPQFNYVSYNCKPYRYLYGNGTSSTGESVFFDQIVKVDLDTKESKIWYEPGKYPSEPVFVEAPEPNGEDDGVVLSAVIDVKNDTTSLLILDAKDFKELAVAVVPVATSYPLHGRFLTSK